MDGGSPFRACFGVERDGETLLAEGSYTRGSELTDGYPEFTMDVLKKLGWDRDRTQEERTVIEWVGGDTIEKVSWSAELSGGNRRGEVSDGCHPYGKGQGRDG